MHSPYVSPFGGPREITPSSSGSTSPRFVGVRSASQLPSFQPAPEPPASQELVVERIFPDAAPESLRAERGKSDVITLPQGQENAKSGIETCGESLMKYFLTVMGALLLCLALLTPILDSARLLSSKTFLYFIGKWVPLGTIFVCCLIILVFVTSMLYLEKYGRRELKTDQTFMYLFMSTIPAMGLAFVFFGSILQTEAQTAYDQLMINPLNDPLTAPLAADYHALLEIRLKSSCRSKSSVEECSGYDKNNTYSSLLKYMELKYKCSGFGYSPKSSPSNHSKPVSLMEKSHDDDHDLVGFLQASGAITLMHVAPAADRRTKTLVEALQRRQAKKSRAASAKQQNQANQWISLFTGNQTLSKTVPTSEKLSLFTGNQTLSKTVPSSEKLPRGKGDTGNNMVATGWMKAYPPIALFNQAKYVTTCEGAAAREIRFTALEVARLMYIEGEALLLASIVVGFLKICSMCRTSEEMMEDKVQKLKKRSGEASSLQSAD